MPRLSLRLALLAALLAVAPPAQRSWRELQKTTLGAGQSVYDAARDRFVMVARGQTMEWDGRSWQVRRTNTPDRINFRLAFDRVRSRTVLFGGHPLDFDTRSGQPLPRDVWEYDGSVWNRIQSAQGPAGRISHTMAFEPMGSRVVLFGGWRPFGASVDGETWSWDGASWQSLPMGPLGMSNISMAFQPSPPHLVLHGTRSGVLGGETWRFAGGSWALAASSGNRFFGHMATDFAGSRTLLLDRSGPVHAWDGTAWTSVVASGSPPQLGLDHGWAVDDTGDALASGGLRTIVVPGVIIPISSANGDTWRLSGSQWTRPEVFGPGRMGGAIYDQTRNVLLLLDTLRSTGARIWEWDATRWTERPSPGPEPRIFQDGAFGWDAGRQRAVLFGGFSIPPGGFPIVSNELWEWDGLNWTQVTSGTSGPRPRVAHAMVYEAARNRMLVFGGQGPAGIFDETWVWDGVNWANANPAGARPPAANRTAMAYDPVRDRVVLFGGDVDPQSARVAHDETWEWDGASWRQRFPAQSPPALWNHTMAHDARAGRVALIGGFFTDPSGNPVANQDEWHWDGANWSVVARGLAAARGGPESLVNHPGLGGLLAVRDIVATQYDTVSMWLGASDSAAVTESGAGCAGSGDPPRLRVLGDPWLGNPALAFDVVGGPGRQLVALGLEPQRAQIGAGSGCTLWIGPGSYTTLGNAGSSGAASFRSPVPAASALLGAELFAQAGVFDPGVARGFALTNARRIRLGR